MLISNNARLMYLFFIKLTTCKSDIAHSHALPLLEKGREGRNKAFVCMKGSRTTMKGSRNFSNVIVCLGSEPLRVYKIVGSFNFYTLDGAFYMSSKFAFRYP